MCFGCASVVLCAVYGVVDQNPPSLAWHLAWHLAWQASTAFRLNIQFWTSRGFAVADVDYGGSTGYGRAYRERLKGRWGLVDVDDCCAIASHLTERGEVDGEKLAIDGGSAGGFTTLACLTMRKVDHTPPHSWHFLHSQTHPPAL